MTEKDPFAAYIMPDGLTDTVEIALPKSPAVFTVRLPTSMNEDHQTLIMAEAARHRLPDGGIDAAGFANGIKKLFFDNCVLSATGLPEGMDVGEFFKQFPVAKRVLWELVDERRNRADDHLNEALKKFVPSLSGSTVGEGEESSTKT